METKIFKPDQVDQVVKLLRAGEIVAVPTETVYGLAADAKNACAIAHIFRAKGRPSDHPLIVHIDSLQAVEDWALHISEHAKRLAEHFWPGPLTMVFAKKDGVSDLITGGLNTVAIRMPAHPIALEVITKLGNAIVAPSANAHKKISPTKPEHVLKTLQYKIPAIIDGGSCSVGIESTIIDMTKSIPVILRPGAVTQDMLKEVLAINIEAPHAHQQKIPGNMPVHYQPEKPLFIFSLDQLDTILVNEPSVAVMHYSQITKRESVDYYQISKNKEDYARDFYNILHQIDATDVEKIFVEMIPDSKEWADIADRLLKASSKE
jgi:L-threonylcarbamoyladenylate synthase